MPDNIINAMKGLTQYLMVENQRLEVEREDKKINDAANQIAEAYKNLGPDATIEDIRKIQFASVSSATKLGVIQEVMPMINQMQSSSLQTFSYNQAEKMRNATSKFITDRYGVDVSGVADPVAMSELMYKRQDNEKVVDETNKTFSVKYDDKDPTKEISRREIGSFGAKEELDLYKQKKEVDYQYDSKLLNAKLNSGLYGTNGPNGPQFRGMDPILTHEGINGEVLYKSKKGGGVYALQPDNSLLFYNGQPQPTKGNVQDAQYLQDQNLKNQEILTGLTSAGLWSMSQTEEGKKAYKQLMDKDLPKFTKEEEYNSYAKEFEEVLTDKNWDSIVKTVGKDLSGKTTAKRVYDFLGNVHRLPKTREETRKLVYKTPTPPKKFGTMTQEQYNLANEKMLEAFSPKSTLRPETISNLKGWIAKKINSENFVPGKNSLEGLSQGNYDDFKKLRDADKLLILELINKWVK